MKRRLITSALPYVNNAPHLGNLIQVLSADAFARFCRLRGYDTLYVCGTDEYGTATETRAAQEDISPRALCDRYHIIHTGIYEWFTIAFDKFGRTSTPIQTEVVQDIFRKLDANGLILERTIEQSYCPSCKRFLADRYVRGTCPVCGDTKARGDQCEQCGTLLDPAELREPRCALCASTPVLRETKHLYIDLPRIKDALEAWVQDASQRGFWSNNAIAMTQAWIRDGLRERAITRDLSWGIPVPKAGYENKVFYVWFDAPIGYISITGNLAVDRGDDWHAFVDSWWKSPDDVELFQFIGKDNIPFHTVVFPSSLIGASGLPTSGLKQKCEWTLLHHMSSTEYLNYEGGKFSKADGIGVFGTDVMETGIPSDVWRFYLFYNRPEKADSLFTWKDFQEKVNSELIGNLGNLVNRTLAFVLRYYDGAIPAGKGDAAFWERVTDMESALAEKLERADLRDAFHRIFELSSFANKTFQDGEPWRTRVSDPEAAAGLIGDLVRVVRDIAVLIEPYLPATAEQIASFFGLTFKKEDEGRLSWRSLGVGGVPVAVVMRNKVLFTRLEDEVITVLREKYAGSQHERREKALDFAATLDLRVAQIIKVQRHPDADKLYIETLALSDGISTAPEERVIVSGLVPFYREEELLNRRIIVAYNLKPARLRGVESRGMLLAASCKGADGGETLEVLDAGDAPLGTRVTLEGAAAMEEAAAEVDVETFFSIPITVKDHGVQAQGKALTVAGKALMTSVVKDGGVR
jgi:methionyl-tRNA synthetase